MSYDYFVMQTNIYKDDGTKTTEAEILELVEGFKAFMNSTGFLTDGQVSVPEEEEEKSP